MTNRIDSRFSQLKQNHRVALIPFITAGDPHPDWTVDTMHGLVRGGANLIELGMPFSDPSADGPVIQEASERAIEKGMSAEKILHIVRQFRESDSDTPVVLMGYLNPIERFGYEAFAPAAEQAGVDGLLLVDCPPEESSGFRDALKQSNVYAINLVAPTTTTERKQFIASQSQGFLYYVSFKGITGANRLDQQTLAGPIEQLKKMSDVPVAVGFGIKDAESACAVAGMADGVVIGSALVSHLAGASSSDEAASRAEAFLAPIRLAMDNIQS